MSLQRRRGGPHHPSRRQDRRPDQRARCLATRRRRHLAAYGAPGSRSRRAVGYSADLPNWPDPDNSAGDRAMIWSADARSPSSCGLHVTSSMWSLTWASAISFRRCDRYADGGIAQHADPTGVREAPRDGFARTTRRGAFCWCESFRPVRSGTCPASWYGHSHPSPPAHVTSAWPRTGNQRQQETTEGESADDADLLAVVLRRRARYAAWCGPGRTADEACRTRREAVAAHVRATGWPP
jgi:hypothetical protein